MTRLWLTDAPLWLLDEPAAALDASARKTLASRINEHAATGGITIFTTHESLDIAHARPIELPVC